MQKRNYKAGLRDCKNHLHSKILLNKGDKLLTHLDLCKKLDVTRSSLATWKVISSGKGFYELKFSSLEDMCHVLPVGLCNLFPSLLPTFA